MKLSAGVVLAGLVGVGLMRPGVPSAEPTVTQFLLAWQSKHYLAAARLTTGQPREVAAELARAYERLDASDLNLSMRGVSQRGTSATAQFEASVDLGASGLTWSYPNSFALTDGAHGWRVVWSPAVIVPGMTNHEQLAVISTLWPRQDLLDSAGRPLEVASKVYQVGVYPGRLANPQLTADDLAAVTQLPAEQIQGQMQQGLSADYLSLLTLSPRQYAAIRSELKAIPGIQVRERTERLFDSIAPDVVGTVGTENAARLRINGEQYRPGTTIGLSGLQQTFQRQLVGTPQTKVVLQQAGKAAVLVKKWPGSQGRAVHTTLSSTIQLAADRAVDQQAGSSAIVAVQASTGKILAVASKKAGGLPGLSPLTGQYQPGQAFTIVSSAARLASGSLSLSDPIPCRSSNAVDGRNFFNDPPVRGLGSAPSFEADFAHACSTAFAGLSLSVTASDLARASQAFGISGTGGWSLPGSNSFAGSLGQPSGGGQLAAAMVGLGSVRVSPLGMALAAAVVDSGRWHSPSLVTGMADASASSRAAASPGVLTELRQLMRSAARTRANSVADVGGTVHAQAGNAPAGAKRLRISWFVGYQGDVAFVSVQLSTSSATSAAPLAAAFLQDVRAGI